VEGDNLAVSPVVTVICVTGADINIYIYIVGPVAQSVLRLTADWTIRDRITVGRDFPPVLTGPVAHPAPCTMGTGSYPGVKFGRDVLLTTHTF